MLRWFTFYKLKVMKYLHLLLKTKDPIKQSVRWNIEASYKDDGDFVQITGEKSVYTCSIFIQQKYQPSIHVTHHDVSR